jgi:Flp pilus assembly protein TadG
MTILVSGRRSRGQSLTEFALILPILLLIIFGVVDFGRAIYAYNAVSNAAREGGRTAIVNQTASDIRSRAIQQATALGIDAASVSCPPAGPSGVCIQFKNATLTADCSPATGALGCVAVITVKYSMTPLTPIIGSIIGSIPISAQTKQAIESVCTTGGTVTCPIP